MGSIHVAWWGEVGDWIRKWSGRLEYLCPNSDTVDHRCKPALDRDCARWRWYGTRRRGNQCGRTHRPHNQCELQKLRLIGYVVWARELAGSLMDAWTRNPGCYQWNLSHLESSRREQDRFWRW